MLQSVDLPNRNLKSDRLLSLTAACIRAVMWIRFKYELPFSEALDLARVHDLRSALDEIAAKIEVHRNLPDSNARVGLAIVESKLEHPVAKDVVDYSEKVVAIRLKTAETLSARTTSAEDRASLLSMLRGVRIESQHWAQEYSRFFIALANLYRQTRSDLMELELNSVERDKALGELERIMSDAICSAGRI